MDETLTDPRRQSVGRATLLNLLGQTLPLPAGLLAIPILIDRLGASRFGWLSLLWAISAYFGLFDLGIGRATTKALSEAIATRESHRFGTILWSASAAQLTTGVAAACMAAFIATPLSHAIGAGSEALRLEARDALLVFAIAIPAVTISSSWRGALEAHGRFDLVNAVRTPLTISFFLIPLFIVLSTPHLVPITAGLAAAQIVACMAYVALVRRIQPQTRTPTRPSYREVQKLLRFGGWLTASDVVAPILLYLDRFLLGALSSPARVAFYTAPFDVVTRLWLIPNSIVSALFPALTRRVMAGSAQEIRSSARRAIRYVAAAVGWIVALAVADASGHLRAWLGDSFARESAVVLQLLAVAILINSVAQIAHVVILAYGRSDIAAKIHLAEVPFHAVILVLFINRWGVEGAAGAWLVRVTVDAGLMFRAATSLIGRDMFALVDRRLAAVIGVTVAMGALIYLSGVHLQHPLFTLLALAGLFGLWFAALDPLERRGVSASLMRRRTAG